MKRWLCFLFFGVFLCIPLAAHAVPLGSGVLYVNWSTPTGGGYYTDYDGRVGSSDFGYTTGVEEIFCVSHDDANWGEEVDFYKIDSNLDGEIGVAGLFDRMSRAAWIADNWMDVIDNTSSFSPYQLDILKGEAQKAVWAIMGVMDIINGSGDDYYIYNLALEHTGYLTDNWYFAYDGFGDGSYQDYLTPAAPVPEPATMLLLGSGLIGLSGLGRRRFLK